MGSLDRDYTRQQPADRQSRLTPVTKWLLIVNVLIAVLDLFVLSEFFGTRQRPISEWGAFSIQSAIFEGRIWEFITFQFLHASPGHILSNGIGLYFFGPWMERWWGSRRFLIFYLLCGAAGAAFFSLLTFLNLLPVIPGYQPFEQGLVGASAGLFGILVGIAVTAPNLQVMLLFPPVKMSMRQLALIFLTISVGSIVFKWGGNEGGEAGHLGGAILGFLLVKFPSLLGKGGRPDNLISPPQFKARRRSEPKLRPRTEIDLQTATEVDRILDKMNRDGVHSLTDEERETLQKASENRS